MKIYPAADPQLQQFQGGRPSYVRQNKRGGEHGEMSVSVNCHYVTSLCTAVLKLLVLLVCSWILLYTYGWILYQGCKSEAKISLRPSSGSLQYNFKPRPFPCYRNGKTSQTYIYIYTLHMTSLQLFFQEWCSKFIYP